MRKAMSVLLATLLLLTCIPLGVVSVSAATNLNTSVEGLVATWEHVTGNGGSATWSSSGTSITCTTVGTVSTTNTSRLTLTNAYAEEAFLSFHYAFITAGTSAATRATLSGALTVSNQESASGLYSVTLAGGESVSVEVRSPRVRNGEAVLNLTEISLVSADAADSDLVFKPAANGGTYTLDGVAVAAEVAMNAVAPNTIIRLVATPDQGYNFYGWYDEQNETYLSQDLAFNLTVSRNATIIPVFISEDVALFGVGSAKFDSLSAAGAAAAAGINKTIVLLNDGTLSGEHTVPAGTTLLIPYNEANTAYGAVPSCTSTEGNSVPWETPTKYRELTMAADAKITVNGNLEVGGRHSAAGGSGFPAAPTGALGYIYMAAGAEIVVNGNLYAWGYIYGDGTVTAHNGAGIYEVFQMNDFRGGSATLALASDLLVFPMTQYYVQNVEVATTYHYGATAYVTTSMFVSAQCVTAPPIKFIGAGAMFQPGEGSYIVKEYDPATDTLNLDAYGDCSLSTMKVELAGNAVDTSNFVLPITNNIHITIKEGTAVLLQDTAMLPGSSLTVDKGATLEIGAGETASAGMSAGYNLIIYDSENWTCGINPNTFENETGLNYVHNGAGLVPVKYSPSEHKIRTRADLGDVVLDINGTVVADGYLYSSVTWRDPTIEDFSIVSGGGAIRSSQGTGVVAFNGGAGNDFVTFQYDQSKDTAYKAAPDYDPESGGTLYYLIPLASAQLQNGDGTLLDTTGAEAGAVFTYCAHHDHWIAGEECSVPTSVEITFVVNGESEMVEVPFGSVPEYPGGTPQKALENNHHYVFAGWSATQDGQAIDLPAAEGAATYYAVFTAVAHAYGESAQAGKHACVCGKKASCFDAESDGDHLCDLGCGDIKSSHIGGTATCAQQAICTECSQGYGALIDHVWVDATCTDAKTCSVCGTTEGEANGHDYTAVVTAPTCTTGGYTTYTCACGDTYVADETAALGHTWVDATCTVAKICSVCGATEGEANGHDYTAVVTAPTCTTGGYTTYTCACGNTYVADETAALGHTWDAGKVTKKATCKVTGVKTYTCTVCKTTKTETIAKSKTHTYTNACDKSCNVCGATRTVAAHTYKKVITKATLTKDGKIKNVCSKCGYTASKVTTIYKASKISLSKTSYTYNGKTQKPSVVVKDAKGKTISSSHYTVTYASGRKNVGTYKVTIKMKGNYTGTKTLTFKINPPKTTVKATAAKKSLKLAIGKKSTQVTGYEVQYSTGKSFKTYKSKTLTSYKKTSLTLTGLKAKTTYYVRVRTYKTVNGKKYYSGWSTIVYKKTK